LIKHACIKGGPGISTDERVYNMRLLKGASVGATVPIFYPRMFSIDDLPENVMALLLRILFCCWFVSDSNSVVTVATGGAAHGDGTLDQAQLRPSFIWTAKPAGNLCRWWDLPFLMSGTKQKQKTKTKKRTEENCTSGSGWTRPPRCCKTSLELVSLRAWTPRW